MEVDDPKVEVNKAKNPPVLKNKKTSVAGELLFLEWVGVFVRFY
ncbi:hypothetical protein GCM10007049_17280 [Echinicola pacifica]|uniref:Uncharacterized protein n=1 Tax=Echinicola pacifica TaxID=346377 RepID=A0A918UPT3_9BACT|nr:hypothetical protein GCM10007049_17280 [Echinicola pacifica]